MAGYENLCMNCMSDTAGKSECPNCGCQSGEPQAPHALPLRVMLQNRYIVGRMKSNNGEGMTYIGYDTVLRLPVEVREFFPQSLCERTDGEADIRILPGNEVAFNEYLADFLSYARDIAHLRELSTIVQISSRRITLLTPYPNGTTAFHCAIMSNAAAATSTGTPPGSFLCRSFPL